MRPTGVDWTIADLAAEQHGVVSRIQLLERGVSANAIAWRAQQGRLHRIHRGVYLVGHTAVLERTREMAAVLACGPRSLISHRSAARLWSFLPDSAGDPVDISVVAAGYRRRPGIRVYRTRTLDRREIRRLQGIPLTSPRRTLLDVAGLISASVLERAVAEAEVRRLARRSELLALLDRHPGQRGAGPLRALLDRESGPALTRSTAEEKLLALVRSARLPEPEANVTVCGYEVDFLWRRQRVIAEVDGYRFHSTRRAFERDRSRDGELETAGYEVIRVTWRQLVDEPAAVAARIATALARASS